MIVASKNLNRIKLPVTERVFSVFNYIFLTCMTLAAVLPFLHLLAISFSSNLAASAGEVGFWPVGFTFDNYSFISDRPEFLTAFWVSIQRVFLGIVVNMSLCILTAYPLSKPVRKFHARQFYIWFFAFTMFFGGGLIPTYLVIKMVGLIDSIWALVLPGALQVGNCILLMRFFNQVPPEMEEAALMDGANHWQILISTYLPISLPALATVLLFVIVGHWNAWFDGIIYLNDTMKYPLQTYLSIIVRSANADVSKMMYMTDEQLAQLQNIGEQTVRASQIFLGALPILCVYPFMQRYFIKGIALGGVKG